MTNPLLENLSPKTKSKISFVKNNIDLEKITDGLVSIHSSWSGQSIKNGISILQLIDEFDVVDFNIYIIDNDSIQIESQKDKLGFKSNGYFESAFLLNGHVKTVFQNQNIDIENFTRKIKQLVTHR